MSSPAVYTMMGSYEVLETLPHDSSCFTQGLVVDTNNPSIFYESAGLYMKSDVRRVDIRTGGLLDHKKLQSKYFAEGLTFDHTGERLLQITWKEQMGFIYNATDLTEIDSFSYETQTSEGWGITYDSNREVYLVSDGSSIIMFWDKDTLEEVSRISVTEQFSGDKGSKSVPNLNELEWDPITDTLLANIWHTDHIVRIDLDTGFVLTKYDLTGLDPKRGFHGDVLNGIALVLDDGAGDDEYWITGKKWPNMYRLRLTEEPKN